MTRIIFIVLLIIPFLIILASCGGGRSEHTIVAYPKLMVVQNHYLDSMGKLFIKESNCRSCIYEAYIQKRNDNEFYLGFKSFNKDRNHRSKPTLLSCNIDSTPILIYCGLEDFITFQNGFINKAVSSCNDYLLSWTIVKNLDSAFIVKDVSQGFIYGNLKQTVKFNEVK